MQWRRVIKRHNQSGNILFLILIAVALFAAISYVVTDSSRGGGRGAEREKARMMAADIYNQATAVQAGITRLIARGCGLDRINFGNDLDALHDNPGAPSDGSCDVFRPAGAGVAAREGDRDIGPDIRFYYSGASAFTNIGSTCASSDCADLALVVRDIGGALCEALNAMNGWNISSAMLPTDTQPVCPYKGTLDCNGNGVTTVIFSNPQLAGKNSVCYRDTVYNYTFIHVVHER